MMKNLKKGRYVFFGGTLMIKTLKMDKYCLCDNRYRGRGVDGEEGGTIGWGNFNRKKTL